MGYTIGEHLARARLGVQGGRRAQMGLSTERIDKRLDRIEERANDRYEREFRKAEARIDQALDAVADARVELRMAKGRDKADARRALNDAKQALRRAECSGPRG